MLRKLYFLFRDIYYQYVISFLVKLFLRALGIKVGAGFFARRFPSVVLDEVSTITVGDDVILKGRVELRALKGANISLGKGVRLDVGVRIVATNACNVLIGEGSDIGCYSIFNCGDDFSMGKYCLVAGFCYFQTSDHNIGSGQLIQKQGYSHGNITIGDDAWIAGGSFILSNVDVADGCVIGANSVVNRSISCDSIAVGSPAKVIGKRT